jgi:hypothetical protein
MEFLEDIEKPSHRSILKRDNVKKQKSVRFPEESLC